MFEKFGEFNSYEEINKKAEELKAAGSEKELLSLCKENGIDEEDGKDFFSGDIEQLVNAKMAAMGKIKAEMADLKLKGVLSDWAGVIFQLMTDDPELAVDVRKKGKDLCGLMAKLLKSGFDSKDKLDDRIVKAAGLKPPIYLGIPSTAEVKKAIKEYYLGGNS